MRGRTIGLILGILLCWFPNSGATELHFPEIAGWKRSADIQTFTPQSLYEYINGAADLYLSCDFEELQVAEYLNERKASVTLEAYRHRTPRDAFGIYSQERLPEGDFLRVGAQGYVGRIGDSHWENRGQPLIYNNQRLSPNKYPNKYSWTHEERWAIINGEAYAMTPAPSLKHQEAGITGTNI